MYFEYNSCQYYLFFSPFTDCFFLIRFSDHEMLFSSEYKTELISVLSELYTKITEKTLNITFSDKYVT